MKRVFANCFRRLRRGSSSLRGITTTIEFSAPIEQHNHGVVPKPEQLTLLEERAEYVARQLGRGYE